MDKLYSVLPAVLSAGVKNENVYDKVSGISPELFSRLIKFATEHGVSSAFYMGLVNSNITVNDYPQMKDLEKRSLFNELKTEKLIFEEQSLFELFEKHGINYLVMKGTVLRALYQNPSLRSSCDIDVVLDKKDKKKVFSLLEENGYIRVKDYEEEITYKSSGNQAIELHFDITEGDKSLKPLFEGYLERATRLEDKKFGYKLCAEDFVIYHISHIAKHLKSGGCGIKSIMDLYVMAKSLPYSEEIVEKRLQSAGLIKLYEELIKLKDYWFMNKSADETTTELARFIIDGGAYGSDEMQNGIKKERKGKVKYFFSRVFVPYGALKTTYPVLVKWKVLYPFCLIHRFFKYIFGKKEKIKEESGNYNAEKASKLLMKLGL